MGRDIGTVHQLKAHPPPESEGRPRKPGIAFLALSGLRCFFSFFLSTLYVLRAPDASTEIAFLFATHEGRIVTNVKVVRPHGAGHTRQTIVPLVPARVRVGGYRLEPLSLDLRGSRPPLMGPLQLRVSEPMATIGSQMPVSEGRD